jgi:uncharacterized protein (TIGR02996 family)
MGALDALLAGIVADPLEETRWLVLADYLEENDDPRRAELLRLQRKLLGTCCEPEKHPESAKWHEQMPGEGSRSADGVSPLSLPLASSGPLAVSDERRRGRVPVPRH